MKKIPILEAGNHKYELHYSDGVRGVFKGNSQGDLIRKVIDKPNVKEWALFKNDSGFHSTADEKYLIEWWGDGSYWDNRSKKESELLKKKTLHKMPDVKQSNEGYLLVL